MAGPLGATMASEIAEAPRVVAAQLDGVAGWARPLRALVAAAAPAGLRGVALTARGSSDHAAAYGRYLLEQALGVPAWSTAPSLVTRYGAAPSLEGVLAIAVSQSGRTPEIVSALEAQRAGGAVTVAVTNDPSSPLADAAALCVPLEAGVERAVPATKTFTATLLAFALLAAELESGEGWPGRFAVPATAVVDAIAAAVATPEAVEEAATWLAPAEIAIHVGRGVLLPIAREAALKLIETTATAHLAWSTVDVRHGPIALAETGHPVLVHHAPGPVSDDAASLVERLAAGPGAPWVIGEPLAGQAGVVPVPGNLPEHLRPLVHAIRLQQLSLAVARARGADPDQPAGLNKVTATT